MPSDPALGSLGAGRGRGGRLGAPARPWLVGARVSPSQAAQSCPDTRRPSQAPDRLPLLLIIIVTFGVDLAEDSQEIAKHSYREAPVILQTSCLTETRKSAQTHSLGHEPLGTSPGSLSQDFLNPHIYNFLLISSPGAHKVQTLGHLTIQ